MKKKYFFILMVLLGISAAQFSDKSGGWVTKTPDQDSRSAVISEI